MMKFTIIKEGKRPVDERVVLTPSQVADLNKSFSTLNFSVQKSEVRRISDAEYEKAGVSLTDDLTEADVLLGVKEVPIDQLVPNKTYLFFSHTIKKQPYNKPLLKAILERNIRLIDWETLKDARGRRLIGFGRYAGIVGTYNGFRALGQRDGLFSLKQAKACRDRKELELELMNVKLPPIKILLTGRGKVAKGALEVLNYMNIKKVSVRDYLTKTFDEPVYCQITFTDYFKPKDGGAFDTNLFYNAPENFESDFMRFARVTNFYIAGHFWDAKAPFLFTREDARSPDFKIDLIADISCDVDGPVASTIRASTIADPFYGYDPKSEKEVAFDAPGAITVMAVDNLPCELPRDASKDFGEMFTHAVLPSFINGDKHGILKRATIAENGLITDAHSYLRDWVNT